MKQLQNHFTTPEQSKRLLKLGVPAGSADCYWNQYHKKVVVISHGGDVALVEDGVCLPCWSVGRLIEIFVKAREYEDSVMSIRGDNPIECLMNLFCKPCKENYELDFSKI